MKKSVGWYDACLLEVILLLNSGSNMYSRILVALDGSEASLSGLNEAIGIAETRIGHIRLLHVVRSPELDYGYSPGQGRNEVIEAMCKSGKEIISDAERHVRESGLTSESVLYEMNEGSAASVILEQAQQWRANLIVLGSHARPARVGSDTGEVLAKALVPVLLVRRQASLAVD
jgi:nucleotide-binding universal stress UspA family protein